MGKAIEATFGPARRYPLDRRAAGMLLPSLLENVPERGRRRSAAPPTDEEIVEAQALFIERVMLSRLSEPPPTRSAVGQVARLLSALRHTLADRSGHPTSSP